MLIKALISMDLLLITSMHQELIQQLSLQHLNQKLLLQITSSKIWVSCSTFKKKTKTTMRTASSMSSSKTMVEVFKPPSRKVAWRRRKKSQCNQNKRRTTWRCSVRKEIEVNRVVLLKTMMEFKICHLIVEQVKWQLINTSTILEALKIYLKIHHNQAQ